MMTFYLTLVDFRQGRVHNYKVIVKTQGKKRIFTESRRVVLVVVVVVGGMETREKLKKEGILS